MDAILLSHQATILANYAKIEGMRAANQLSLFQQQPPKYTEYDFEGCNMELYHIANALRNY